jgi:hypothetical protein
MLSFCEIKTIIFRINHKYILITSKILLQYDAIITIGKTAQFALALGIPLYNYDYFGGPGWITPHNLDLEESYNFAGRKMNHNELQKDSETIAKEIISGEEVSTYQNHLSKMARERYHGPERIGRLVREVETQEPVKRVCITKDNRLYFDLCKLIVAMAEVPVNLAEDARNSQ